jgi:hypothetical protein
MAGGWWAHRAQSARSRARVAGRKAHAKPHCRYNRIEGRAQTVSPKAELNGIRHNTKPTHNTKPSLISEEVRMADATGRRSARS